MDKIEIIELLSKVSVPVYQIEQDLGMPKTTLQKAIKGERELPKKWWLLLKEKYEEKKEPEKPQIEISENDLHNLKILKEIMSLKEETIPSNQNTPMGKVVWEREHKLKIFQLEKKIIK